MSGRYSITLTPRRGRWTMIERLEEAWQGFLDLYVRTNIQPPGGPVSAVIWGEADVQLLVAYLLMSSPGGALDVHQEVVGLRTSDPVDLVVTDPEPWLKQKRVAWALFTPATPVDLAVEVKVVHNRSNLDVVKKAARKLQAVLKSGLVREVAMCVLDKMSPPDRAFYGDLEDSSGVLIVRTFDDDLPRA